MRFRKIAPGPRPRHASSLSLVKVAVAQASGAGMSLSKAGPSSQPNHDFPEVTPVTASSPGHHTGRDKARYSRGQIHTWPAVDYADQPCVIHDNLWRDRMSFSSIPGQSTSLHPRPHPRQRLSQLVLHLPPAALRPGSCVAEIISSNLHIWIFQTRRKYPRFESSRSIHS